MRMIDADKMLERLEVWNTSDNTDKALYNFARNRIAEQPTAYDINEVVKQLKENYLYSIGNLKMISLDEAIEIVKKGGAK